jgi:hypothetical protein
LKKQHGLLKSCLLGVATALAITVVSPAGAHTAPDGSEASRALRAAVSIHGLVV